ncbi:MAG: hypothetical protein EBU01_11905, partial [Crocinitomicaceae bacterium]|nr:hypothetical protein [Crocinitomicaceae bacterium]
PNNVTCSGTPETFTITVNPTPTTIFSQIGPLCINSTAPTLPAISNNTPAISGTWNPTTISTSTAGTQTFTFTPTAGICATTATMNVVIDPLITPTFTQIAALCQNAVAPTLPTNSTNTPSISGTWLPATISTNTVGTQTYTFTPSNNSCSNTASMSITINSPTSPTFTQIGPYCQNTVPAILPTSSTNSPAITGTWSPNSISTTAVGTTNYTFTPSANQCASSATMSVTINAFPTITLASQTICSGQNVTLTPTVSPNGGTYIWSSNQTTSAISISPTITGNYTVNYTLNACTVSASSTLTVTPNITTNFSQLGPYCQNTTAGLLPTISTNGINGTWSPSTISTVVAGTQTYTFTPSAGVCATSTTMNVVITPSVTPTFNPINTLCQFSTSPVLPTTSLNSPTINGTWTPSIINTSTVGIFTYTFTPNAGICASNATMNVNIIATPVPSFTADQTSGCSPLNVQFTATSFPNATYSWLANNNPIGDGATLNTTFTNSGCSNLTLIVEISGCSGNITYTNYICVEGPPTAAFTVNPVTFTNSNQTATFSNNSVGATSYSWNFGDGSTSNEENPTHVYSNITENILATLTATSAGGCMQLYSDLIKYNMVD